MLGLEIPRGSSGHHQPHDQLLPTSFAALAEWVLPEQYQPGGVNPGDLQGASPSSLGLIPFVNFTVTQLGKPSS
jgi:hypothetical protein